MTKPRANAKRFMVCLGATAIVTLSAVALQSPLAMAQVVFESASGSPTGMGISMGSENWLFHNFEVTETLKHPEVGMFFETYGWTPTFAAIVALDGETDVPDSIDLSTPDLLGTALLNLTSTGSAGGDQSGIVPIVLEPGWYALGFGSGAFGAEDYGSLNTLEVATDLVPNAVPYGQFQGNHSFHPNTRHFYHGFAIRFFVNETDPSPDLDRNGYTDSSDLDVWQAAYGESHTGDADGDDDSDGADFLSWQRGYDPAPLLDNGDFETERLDPWQIVTTPNGVGSPHVRQFDVNGDGTENFAVRIRAGMADFPGESPAGAGIKQTFTVPAAGAYSVNLDIAAINLGTSANSSPGRFEIFVNEELVDVVDMEGISVQPNETVRDTLAGTVSSLSAGDHTLRVLATRPFLASRPVYQFIDNVSIVRTDAVAAHQAVPEPSTLALCCSLFVAGSRCRGLNALSG